MAENASVASGAEGLVKQTDETTETDQITATTPTTPIHSNGNPASILTPWETDLSLDGPSSSLPLLQYSQLAGLPRRPVTDASEENGGESSTTPVLQLAIPRTCSALGQVLLDPIGLEDATIASSGAGTVGGAATLSGAATNRATARTSQNRDEDHADDNDDDDDEEDPLALLRSDLWKQPHPILAVGWETGHVSLQAIQLHNGMPVAIEAGGALGGGDTNSMGGTGTGGTSTAGTTLAASLPITTRLTIRDSTTEVAPPAVDVSWDSSGTLLGAIDQGGTCCLWEFKYKPSWQPSNLGESFNAGRTIVSGQSAVGQNPVNNPGNNNMFSSFMSALTGMPASPEEEAQQRAGFSSTEPATSGENHSTSNPSSPSIVPPFVPALAASVVNLSRITYPSHWQSPTCMVLDPAHKKGKSTRALIVGFADGRLILTKRGGGLFQRRNDTVLYHGSSTGSDATPSTTLSSYRGIESVAWRGNLVAWADASGMKLLDVETLTRIAHIDRPTGARPSLYPTLTHLKPHLAFETSQKLLVAWGDCLMTMEIREEAAMGEGSSVAVHRKVECTMAWELDCVAAGVLPLDSEHILVLGVVVPDEVTNRLMPATEASVDDSAVAVLDISPDTNHSNELELQIVARDDGTVHYADILPLEGRISSATDFQSLSTFQLPRMDNTNEWQQYRAWSGEAGGSFVEDLDLTLLAAAGMNPGGSGGGLSPTHRRNSTFVDSHLQWKLQSLAWKDEEDEQPTTKNKLVDEKNEDDAASVDSDDYAFVLRPLVMQEDQFLETQTANKAKPSPPLMIVASRNELLQVRLSDVDDAIDHALNTQNRPALALKRGLQNRRQLRRYQISDLVQYYLEAVLMLESKEEERENESPSLSLRRMTLAIEAMPVLLGGHSHEWTKWAKTLEALPGALFLLRKQLPVRDPILPPELYEQVLHGMLRQIEQLSFSESGDVANTLNKEATTHFLDSLLAWGPTKVLKEYIKLFQYGRRKGDHSVTNKLKQVEIALQRRYLQTAAGYLHFPTPSGIPNYSGIASNSTYDATKDDSQDSLFDWKRVLEWMIPRVPLVSIGIVKDVSGTDPLALNPSLRNDQIYFEAIARLYMMQGQYDQALQAYLAMAVQHSPISMQDLDESALAGANGTGDGKSSSFRINGESYEFVIALIENHHLHRRLLDPSFLAGVKNREDKIPLFALLRLVGLDKAGEFLLEHCTAPEWGPSSTARDEETEAVGGQQETLPMDQIASQFESRAALLHWYLHLVFERKPEFYIRFPNNAMPPKIVTELHRRHFQLYLDFAGEARNSSKVLAGMEHYMVESKTTPLLRFLREALPVGGISPVDVRRQLETLRSEEEAEGEDGTISSTFALELAYVLEHYSDETREEALGILELYLEGAKSVMLGVTYAQRQRKYSSMLWDKVITYCLLSSDEQRAHGNSSGGILFGSLLEAAALSGADLARLVARIPPGMIVEGLRPRLVAAVADYRLKLGIHEAAARAAEDERAGLLRQVAHRSRRGARYSIPKANPARSLAKKLQQDSNSSSDENFPLSLPKTLRTRVRRHHYKLAISLPMR